MKHSKYRYGILLCLFIGGCILLNGCGKQNRTFLPPESGKIAVLVGTTSEKIAEEKYPNAEILKFDGLSDAVIALQSGKADYVITAMTNCVNYKNHNSDLSILPDELDKESISIAICKEEHELGGEITELIQKYEKDGTLAELREHWIKLDGTAYEITEIPETEGPELRIAISADREPMAFVQDGEYMGMDIELAKRVAYDLGMKPVFFDMKFAAMIPSVTSDKTQIAISNITETAERRESVDFSPKYFENAQRLLTRKEISTVLYPDSIKDISFEEELEELNGKPMGILSGSVFDNLTTQTLPQSEKLYFNSVPDLSIALDQGKISGFMTDEPVGKMLLLENPTFGMLDGMVMEDHYGYAFQKSDRGEELRDEFNDYLKVLEADGTLEKIKQSWMSADNDSIEVIDAEKLPANRGVIRLGTDGTSVPFSYYRNEQYVGIDIDVLGRFCKEKGYQLEISIMKIDALIPGLTTDKIDIAANCFSITEERKKSVNFSEPTYDGGVVVIVNSKVNKEKGFTVHSIWESLCSSFEKNFVREQRYKLLVSGIGVTLLISIFSLILGTPLGFGICMMRRSANRLLSRFAKIYIRALQGTPIVVLLMIFYYVIFNKTGLSGITVSIIAFGMNYSAYAAEILRSGFEAVDKGQLEAATAIGFTKSQTFRKIVLPQAAVHFLPVLQGEFISLVKTTSVVGYVAVQDLTKASDIIRSRTYEAFFPLIVIAILYFLLSWGLSSSLKVLNVTLDPKRRKLKWSNLTTEGIEIEKLQQE